MCSETVGWNSHSAHGYHHKREINFCLPAKSLQSCPTLCCPMDCSLLGFSVFGILQGRILEWVEISFSRGSSQSRDQSWVSCTVGRFFTIWATREALCWWWRSLLPTGSIFPMWKDFHENKAGVLLQPLVRYPWLFYPILSPIASKWMVTLEGGILSM